MNQGQQIITCTKCGSNKIKKAPGPLLIAIACFLTASLMLWIPILGLIAAPIAAILGILFLIVAFIPSKETMVQCIDCKNNIKISKDTYKEWKAL